MPKKTTTKTRSATAHQTVKFAKGGYYQDLGGNLWFCTNAKPKRVCDDSVVMMQATEDGQPVGDASEQLVGDVNGSCHLFRIRELESILTVTLSNPAAEIKAFTFIALLDDGKAVFYYDTDRELLVRIGVLPVERFRVEMMPDFLQFGDPHCKSWGKAIETDLDELTGQFGAH